MVGSWKEKVFQGLINPRPQVGAGAAVGLHWEGGAAGAQLGTNCPLIKARWGRGAGLGGCGSLLLSRADSSSGTGSPKVYFGV